MIYSRGATATEAGGTQHRRSKMGEGIAEMRIRSPRQRAVFRQVVQRRRRILQVYAGINADRERLHCQRRVRRRQPE